MGLQSDLARSAEIESVLGQHHEKLDKCLRISQYTELIRTENANQIGDGEKRSEIVDPLQYIQHQHILQHSVCTSTYHPELSCSSLLANTYRTISQTS